MRRPSPPLAAIGGLCLCALLAACARRAAAPEPPRELWFYQVVNLAEPDAVERVAGVWARAARAGYARVVLSDGKFSRLGDMDAAYFARAARLRRLADSLGLAIVPCVFPVGRSSPMLTGAPDLAEALPVRDAPFVARGGVAVAVAHPPVALTRPDGADPGVRVSGATAVTGGRVPSRWWYHVRVAPHRAYHVWWSIRTRDFEGRPLVRVNAGRTPLHDMRRLDVARDQDWTRYDLLFDSMDARSVRVLFGLWHPASGTLEWRDWGIEEAGPVNVVRRASAPFVLRDAATGRTLVEGRDYDPVRDPRLGDDPWRGAFAEWHAPPTVRVRVPDGTRLLGSWEHAAVVGGAQVACCLSESLTFVRLADEARRVRELWGPGRYLMMFDEIRALGGDAACLRTERPPARILADAVRRCAALLPADTLYVWGDMFDPAQNAVRDYGLVRGDLAGAWEGVEPRVGIVNWNAPAASRSLRFFAGRGHAQVIAGYYDGAPGDVRHWLDAARGVPGVAAILYATWAGRYDDLEAFARACGR